MRLRNKKTGEIIDDGFVRETHDFQFDGQKHVLAVFKGNGHMPPERVSGGYTSLAELNEEWEDAPEEPKEWWYIDIAGEVKQGEGNVPEHLIEGMKQIGNYFSSREEAEKAVKKLKALKRLKDEGMLIYSFEKSKPGIDLDFYTLTILASRDKDSLDLLFGGEE